MTRLLQKLLTGRDRDQEEGLGRLKFDGCINLHPGFCIDSSGTSV